MKLFASMDIAVIGTGKTGNMFVENLSEAGHNVYLAAMTKEEEIIQSFFCEYENVQLCSIEDAAQYADIIIIATHPKYVREVAYRIDDVRGKVVVDASSILADREESNINTTNAARAITGSPHVVKCFNCQEYETLAHMFYKDEPIDMFIASDSKKAKETLRLLARDIGYTDCYDFGGNEAVPILEDMARCLMNYTAKKKEMALKVMKK
jgi:predicted dinucleotide-binding enzyme